MTIAIYPGSFDPVTNGHLDIARRAASLFEKLIVAIYDAPPKTLLFSTQERVEMMAKALEDVPNVGVQAYDCLTVEFARNVGAQVIVRGLRATSDYEMEFQMELMNKQLAPELETVFLTTNLAYQFLSSSLLKEVVQLGGDIGALVPKHVAAALKKAYRLPP